MKIKMFIAIVVIGLLNTGTSLAQSVADYLILQDIGLYKLDKPEKMLPGEPPSGGPRIYDSAGAVAGTDHFTDHIDKTYEVMYLGGDAFASPTVQVTQHAGVDSDKWLLHESDIDFRNYYGIPGGSYAVVPIDGNYVLEFGSAGWDYRWLSGNKVIKIQYHDSQMTKPEPLEVVKAYLAKHPSTIPAMTLTQLRSAENKTKWIIGEMERRLWLGDKWAAIIQPSDPKLRDKLKSMTDSMVVFLNYREKYYGISAKDEKIALDTALFQNNVSAIQAKLTEYKGWWSTHKGDSITLP